MCHKLLIGLENNLTPYQDHVNKWKNCTLCDSCKHRNKVVLIRGSIPADLLFIGESPGPSEDSIGKVFIGPAGKLLDEIIEESIGAVNEWLCDCPEAKIPFSYALTNLVACIPKGDDSRKFGEPDIQSIKACQDRLRECVGLCKPRAIINVGKLPEKHVPPMFPTIPHISIVHPAAILRSDISQQPLAKKRCVIAIRNLLETL